MLVQLRRISAVVAVVLVGLGLVVLDPNGPSAIAYTGTPPLPLTWVPAQVTEVPNTMNPDQWNKTLTNNPNRVIANPGTAGSGLSKLGGTLNGAAGVIGAATVGVTAGTWISDMVGLPTSGSFVCDVGTAFFGSDCALGPQVAYEANGDVLGTAVPAGWPHGNVMSDYATTLADRTWASGTVVRLNVSSAPGFRSSSGTVTLTTTYSGVWLPGNLTGDPLSATGLTAVFRHVSTGVLYGVSIGSSRCTWSGPVETCTYPSIVGPANTVFDHLESRVTRQVFQAGPVTMPLASSPGLDWYPEGHESWVPEKVENPSRWWRTTWQCSAGAPGGTRTSDPWHETDPEWPGFPQAECSAGSVATSILVEQITQGVDGSTVIFEWAASDGYKEWANSECVGGGCELLLHRIDEVTGRRLSCFGDNSLCVDWSTDPNRDENYECSYGGKVIPLDNCLPYVPTFNPEAPGNYADPDGNPPTAPAPGPGGEPTPETPARDESCPPPFTWTSLVNPWWYYKSTVCALQDVFVPTNSAAQMQRIKNAIDTTTPAVWAGEVSGMFEQVPAASGCQGPELHLTMFGLDKRTYPFSACEAPMSTAAPWVRGVATVLLVVFGSMAAVRALGSGFGWKPSAGGDS